MWRWRRSRDLWVLGPLCQPGPHWLSRGPVARASPQKEITTRLMSLHWRAKHLKSTDAGFSTTDVRGGFLWYDTGSLLNLNMSNLQEKESRLRQGLDGITQSIFPKMNTEIWCRGHCIESRLWISWISTTCRRLCFFWQLQHHFPWDFTILAGTATLSTGSPMRSDSLSVTRNVSTLEYFQQPAKIKRNSLCSQLTNPLILFSFPFISCFQWPSTGWVVELKTKTVRSFNIPNELNSSGSAALETPPLKRKKW